MAANKSIGLDIKEELKAAEKGDPRAQTMVAIMYEEGRGIQQDHKIANEWYMRAAQQGYARAQYLLGARYSIGLGVAKNDAEAFKWIKSAAENGHFFAQYQLAKIYEKGIGTPLDLVLAFEWYQRVHSGVAEDKKIKLHAEESEHNVCQTEKMNPTNKNLKQSMQVESEKHLSELVLQLLNSNPRGQGYKINKEFLEIMTKLNCKNVEQVFKFGLSCTNGALAEQGIPKDPKLACLCFLKAAARGHAVAQYWLAGSYELGLGVTRDQKLALEWYRKAGVTGESEYSEVAYNLGQRYAEGLEIPKDEKLALLWLRRAKGLGNEKASKRINELRTTQCSTVKKYSAESNLKHETPLLIEQANGGNNSAQYYLGLRYLEGQGVTRDENFAFKYLESAAKQDHVEAQAKLGEMYEEGRGTGKNLNLAFYWYEQAARQNHPASQFKVGIMCENGIGTHQDKLAAIEWWQKAALQRNADAQYHLGLFQEANQENQENRGNQGNKVNQSKIDSEKNTIALTYFQKAARLGHPLALLKLGVKYLNGEGVPKDEVKAFELLREAATLNNIDAQYYLGLAYENGKGVTKDLSKAWEWYQLSANKGHLPALQAKKMLQPLFDKTQMEKKLQAQSKQNSIPAIHLKFVISYNELELEYELGKGSFGSVFKGKWWNGDVAIKKMNVEFSSEVDKQFDNEFQVMARLRFPHIVQFYGYCPGPHYCLVMEYMPGGSLYHLLHGKEAIKWDIRIRISTDIACGLAFLHKQNILHCDVKSANVMLAENWRAKLVDFGMSKIRTGSYQVSQNKPGGTYEWLAPELVDDSECTKASDIYSLGVTFWEIATRKHPFTKFTAPRVLIPMRVKNGLKETIPEDVPKKLSTLIQKCWELVPDKRPTADQVAQYLLSEKDNFDEFSSTEGNPLRLSRNSGNGAAKQPVIKFSIDKSKKSSKPASPVYSDYKSIESTHGTNGVNGVNGVNSPKSSIIKNLQGIRVRQV